MKRNKRLLVLLAILLVISLATVLVSNLQTRKEQIRQTEAVVLQVAPDSVTKISWKTADNTLAFKKDAQWLYESDAAFPVSEAKIESILELFSQFGVSFIIEDVKDFGQYGLAEPECTVDLETADGSYELRLGDFSAMDEKRYVSVGDGNVYLVNDDPISLFGSLSDMIANDTVPEFGTVSSLSVTGEDSYKAVAEEENTYTYGRDDKYFREDTKQALDSAKVKKYLKDLHGLSLTDYLTYSCTEEDLQGCGLDAPQMLLTVTDDTGDFTLAVNEKDGNYYARVGQSPIVYNLTKEQFNTVCGGTFQKLRHEKLFYGEFRDVDQIEFKLEGETHRMEVTGDYAEQTWYYEGEEVRATVLQAALSTLRVSSFTDEQPTQKEELSATLTLDLEHCPTLNITLYRYDGSHCLAAINGQSVGLVEREDVVNIIEKVNQIILG